MRLSRPFGKKPYAVRLNITNKQTKYDRQK
jgi:hypothetical protein